MTKNLDGFSTDTKVVHAGMTENEHHAVIPPIYQTSTFKFLNSDHGKRLFLKEEAGFIYTRIGNPTVEAFEGAIAELEDGYKALACSSGMAAIHTVFSALTKNGDHVICSEAVYSPTASLLNNLMEKFGIETTFIDTSNMDNVWNAVKKNTKVIYLESPGNPTLVTTDIRKISEISHKVNAALIVDNTFLSPVLQKPITLGADIVLHSLTKFLNGHADVVGGVIVAKNQGDYELLRQTLTQIGSVLSPMEAFLVHRGIKTLSVRMEKHCSNALKVAHFLEKHPKVKNVMYPGLKSHPQHEIAVKQTKGHGGVIAFELKNGIEACKTLLNNVELFVLAVSLGGVESLIQHPATMTHASMDKNIRLQARITDNLVRISVGIENPDEIINDLKHALNYVR